MTISEEQFIDYISRHKYSMPSSKRESEVRWGNKGSFSADTSEFIWYDFENEKGGNLYQLINYFEPHKIVSDVLKTEFGIEPNQDVSHKAYDYVLPNGELSYQVIKRLSINGKTFYQRRPDGNGGWISNLLGVEPVIYKLPEIINRPNETVYIVEGEKDADKLHSLGLLATTNSGGAGKWDDRLNKYLSGRNIIIIPDNDEAGRTHAQKVFNSLERVARSVTIKELRNVKDKGDVSDYLLTHSLEEFDALPETGKKQLFPFYPIKELIQQPPLDWLIDGIIPSKGIGILAGKSGTYKTFTAIHLALNYLNGQSICGRRSNPKGKVYISCHEGFYGIGHRVMAAADFHDLDPSQFWGGRGLGLANETDIDKIIVDAPDVSLVIIDPMAKAIVGLNEDNAGDITQAINHAERLAEELNCFVLIIDHFGKDDSRGVRGSSAKKANIDTLLSLKSNNNQIRVIVDKQKEGPDNLKLEFEVIIHEWCDLETGEIYKHPVLTENISELSVPDRVIRCLKEYGAQKKREIYENLCHKSVSRPNDRAVTMQSLSQALLRLTRNNRITFQGDRYDL